MGANESTLAGLEGYQIVRVMSNSPAHVAGLVAFFDFITAVDKLSLDRDNPHFFFDYVRRNKDKAITCQVFNLRVRATRDVVVVPSDCWGGVGLLGCNVCWESAESALESTWHIVDVIPDSPAYRADLMAHRDFILGMQPAGDGSTITTFRDGSDFHGRVEEWRARLAVARGTPRTLLLMVFDSVDNSVKEVLLDMSSSNSIGVDVANGYLHVVPPTPNSDKLPCMKRFVVAAGSHRGEYEPAVPPQPRVVDPEPSAVTQVHDRQGSTSVGDGGDLPAAPAFPAPPATGAATGEYSTPARPVEESRAAAPPAAAVPAAPAYPPIASAAAPAAAGAASPSPAATAFPAPAGTTVIFPAPPPPAFPGAFPAPTSASPFPTAGFAAPAFPTPPLPASGPR